MRGRSCRWQGLGIETVANSSEMLELVPGAPKMQRRHIIAVTVGNALEFYDFVTYAFFSIQIGHAFFPAQSAYGSLMLSLATFGAGFITRPIGAFVIGNYADRVGRRPAMMLCFVLMGCAIVGMAVIPTYATIGLAAPILAVLARMTQGFSLGGEIGSNTAYLTEAARARESRHGRLLAGRQPECRRSSPGDWSACAHHLDARRLAGCLRLAHRLPAGRHHRAVRSVAAQQSARDLHSQGRRAASRGVPTESRLALARRHWRIFACGLGYLASGTIGTYIFTYIVTYAQDTMHLSARVGFIAETGGNLLGIPVTLLAGWLSDRHGRRPINIWGNLLFLVLIYPTFAWISATQSEFVLHHRHGLSECHCRHRRRHRSTRALPKACPRSIRGSGFGMTYSLAIAALRRHHAAGRDLADPCDRQPGRAGLVSHRRGGDRPDRADAHARERTRQAGTAAAAGGWRCELKAR